MLSFLIPALMAAFPLACVLPATNHCSGAVSQLLAHLFPEPSEKKRTFLPHPAEEQTQEPAVGA